MGKPDRSYFVTVSLNGRQVGDVRMISGETFFFARAAAALLWGVEPGEIRIAGGKAGGA